VLTLAHRDNFLLYNLAGTAGVIIDLAHTKDLAIHPAGSGPYRVTGFSPGESVDLEASPAAWHQRPQVHHIRFSYYADPTSETAALLSGDLDVVTDLAIPQALSRFSDPKRFTVLRGTTNGEVVLGLNNSVTALSDRRVREAILMAIDRQGLMDIVTNGQGSLIGSMVPPTDPWYTDLSRRWPYNPDRARQLLREAGYGHGLTLRLRVPTLPYATASTRVITAMLAKIGITVVTDELEFPARWLDVVYTRADYDMTVIAHVEPRDIVNWASPDYYWRYRNPAFTALVDQALTGPADQSTARMRQASILLADDAASDFLYLMPKITVARAGITGLQRNAATLSFDLTGLGRSADDPASASVAPPHRVRRQPADRLPHRLRAAQPAARRRRPGDARHQREPIGGRGAARAAGPGPAVHGALSGLAVADADRRPGSLRDHRRADRPGHRLPAGGHRLAGRRRDGRWPSWPASRSASTPRCTAAGRAAWRSRRPPRS
jgi:peptide/nickel transport system substrate-binding protein